MLVCIKKYFFDNTLLFLLMVQQHCHLWCQLKNILLDVKHMLIQIMFYVLILLRILHHGDEKILSSILRLFVKCGYGLV